MSNRTTRSGSSRCNATPSSSSSTKTPSTYKPFVFMENSQEETILKEALDLYRPYEAPAGNEHTAWGNVIKHLHSSDEKSHRSTPLFKGVTLFDCRMASERLGKYKAQARTSLYSALSPAQQPTLTTSTISTTTTKTTSRPRAACRAPFIWSRRPASSLTPYMLNEKSLHYVNLLSERNPQVAVAHSYLVSVNNLTKQIDALKQSTAEPTTAAAGDTESPKKKRTRSEMVVDDLPIDERLSQLHLDPAVVDALAKASKDDGLDDEEFREEETLEQVKRSRLLLSEHVRVQHSIVDFLREEIRHLNLQLEEQMAFTLQQFASLRDIEAHGRPSSSQQQQRSPDAGLDGYLEWLQDSGKQRRDWVSDYLTQKQRHQEHVDRYERTVAQHKERQEKQQMAEVIERRKRVQQQQYREQLEQYENLIVQHKERQERHALEKGKEQTKTQAGYGDARRKRAKRDDIRADREDKEDVLEMPKLSLSSGQTVAEMTKDMQTKLHLDSTSAQPK
ncbi:hypothetical protein BGX33_011721 [Mortierella sp. NVP41]|nr:hypothetical protein BGX33_011721 [Mortierella sp. NVP41]